MSILTLRSGQAPLPSATGTQGRLAMTRKQGRIFVASGETEIADRKVQLSGTIPESTIDQTPKHRGAIRDEENAGFPL